MLQTRIVITHLLKPGVYTWLLLATFFFVFGQVSFAQQDPGTSLDSMIKDLIESLAPDLPEDYDLSELAETLTFLHQHPINLNTASADELKALVFLSPLQISNYFEHIKQSGPILDLLELQSIADFDVGTVQRMLPFVRLTEKVTPGLSLRSLRQGAEQEFITRFGRTLEKQKGFSDLPGSRYLGTPEKLLGKYKFHYKDQISASLVVEKDAGENLFSGSPKTNFDFISGNVAFHQSGVLKKLVIGDYSLQFGQGLTLWTGFGFGKGPDVTSVAKKDLGLKPYSSSNENSYLRGAATTLKLASQLELTAFISRTRQDASTKTDEEGNISQVNIGISGLHRTATEIRNKSDLTQTIYGSVLQLLSNNLSIGMVAYSSHYSNTFATGPLLYNQYNFAGQDLRNVGLHYNYTFQNIYFYGETSRSFPGGMATVNGAMASLSRSLSIVVVNRSYAKDHHNFLARSLGESTDASNETGWYSGLNYIPNKKLAFSVYADVFHFPWLKYRIDAPSSGYEILSQGVYSPTKAFKLVLRLKREIKEQNSDSKADSSLNDVVKTNYRLALNWRFSKSINLENRLEVVNYKKNVLDEMGFLIYQDLNFQPSASRISGNLRVAYFYTDSYNSRLYAYEDDVLYSSGFGLYNGKGIRTYVNVKLKLSKGLNIWGRYAIFMYQNATTVGSGLDIIEGDKKMDVKVQMRYEF
jgi:hypothetical protein